jgi:hypothetical protein
MTCHPFFPAAGRPAGTTCGFSLGFGVPNAIRERFGVAKLTVL